MEENFYKLKNDLMFKAVFANPKELDLLERLIEEVIEKKIKIISINSSELKKKLHGNKK